MTPPETLHPASRRLLEQLEADRHHGASELAARALDALGRLPGALGALPEPEQERELLRAAAAMAKARPSMAAIESVLGRWSEELTRIGTGTPSSRALEATRRTRAWMESARERAIRHAASVIAGRGPVFTHSMSSAVVEAIRRAGEGVREVVVTESRPALEGHRTARLLAASGRKVVLITEAQMGLFVPRCGCVLVGGDAVDPEGTLVNKAGTYPLALVACREGIPLFACLEAYKRTWRRARELPLEEKAAEELEPPEIGGLEVRNVYFDRTPGDLVTAVLDGEEGNLA